MKMHCRYQLLFLLLVHRCTCIYKFIYSLSWPILYDNMIQGMCVYVCFTLSVLLFIIGIFQSAGSTANLFVCWNQIVMVLAGTVLHGVH